MAFLAMMDAPPAYEDVIPQYRDRLISDKDPSQEDILRKLQGEEFQCPAGEDPKICDIEKSIFDRAKDVFMNTLYRETGTNDNSELAMYVLRRLRDRFAGTDKPNDDLPFTREEIDEYIKKKVEEAKEQLKTASGDPEKPRSTITIEDYDRLFRKYFRPIAKAKSMNSESFKVIDEIHKHKRELKQQIMDEQFLNGRMAKAQRMSNIQSIESQKRVDGLLPPVSRGTAKSIGPILLPNNHMHINMALGGGG